MMDNIQSVTVDVDHLTDDGRRWLSNPPLKKGMDLEAPALKLTNVKDTDVDTIDFRPYRHVMVSSAKTPLHVGKFFQKNGISQDLRHSKHNDAFKLSIAQAHVADFTPDPIKEAHLGRSEGAFNRTVVLQDVTVDSWEGVEKYSNNIDFHDVETNTLIGMSHDLVVTFLARHFGSSFGDRYDRYPSHYFKTIDRYPYDQREDINRCLREIDRLNNEAPDAPHPVCHNALDRINGNWIPKLASMLGSSDKKQHAEAIGELNAMKECRDIDALHFIQPKIAPSVRPQFDAILQDLARRCSSPAGNLNLLW